MSRIDGHLRALKKRYPLWRVEADRVTLPIGEGPEPRTQAVDIALDGDACVMTSVVLGRKAVTCSEKTWRDLSVRVWLRNAEKSLVTFSFSESHDLIGVIRQLGASLDLPELEAALLTLARECDRFEFVLTGSDEA